MTVIVGIDPGLDGAIAILRDGTLLDVTDMPTITEGKNRQLDPHGFRHVIEDNYILRVPEKASMPTECFPLFVIEHVSARPGEGASRAFNFGRTCGVIEGLIVGPGHRHVFVTPQAWTKALKRGAGKDASRAMAQRLFPAMADSFARKKDDGRADAALIAWWAHTCYLGAGA